MIAGRDAARRPVHRIRLTGQLVRLVLGHLANGGLIRVDQKELSHCLFGFFNLPDSGDLVATQVSVLSGIPAHGGSSAVIFS
jgi:hypothetical protein